MAGQSVKDEVRNTPYSRFDISTPKAAREAYGDLLKCPVTHNDAAGPFYWITQYEDVRAAPHDSERFSPVREGVLFPPNLDSRRGFALEINPPEHAVWRRVHQEFGLARADPNYRAQDCRHRERIKRSLCARRSVRSYGAVREAAPDPRRLPALSVSVLGRMSASERHSPEWRCGSVSGNCCVVFRISVPPKPSNGSSSSLCRSVRSVARDLRAAEGLMSLSHSGKRFVPGGTLSGFDVSPSGKQWLPTQDVLELPARPTERRLNNSKGNGDVATGSCTSIQSIHQNQ